MRCVKQILSTLAIAGGLFLLTGIALYLYGGLPLFIKLANRPVSEPTAEEYAVYSAFIDNFFASNQPFRLDEQITSESIVYIEDRTPAVENRLSLPPVLGVNAFGPDYDFDQQNARSWPLSPRFRTHMKWALVEVGMMNRATSYGAEKLSATARTADPLDWLPHPRPAGPFPDNPAVTGVLQLSRVGFDWRGKTATLSYLYICGALCGQSGGGVLLEKSSTRWIVKYWGAGMVY